MSRFVIPLRFVDSILISTVHQTNKYKLFDNCSRFVKILDYGFWRCDTWMPRQVSNNCNICLYEGEFDCQKEDLLKPYYYVNPISIILPVSEYNLNTINITVHLNWFFKLVAFEEQLGSNLVFSWDDQFKTVIIEWRAWQAATCAIIFQLKQVKTWPIWAWLYFSINLPQLFPGN
jgi:hypothetical protein